MLFLVKDKQQQRQKQRRRQRRRQHTQLSLSACLSPQPPQLTTNFVEYRGVVNCPLQLLINDYSYTANYVCVCVCMCVQLQGMQSQTSQHLSWFPNTADNQAQRIQSESELVISRLPGADVNPHHLLLPSLLAYPASHLMPYPALGHSGIICYIFTLHSAPKKQQQQQLLSRFTLLSVIRERCALPTRVNLKEISSGLRRHFITIQQTHTHSHTERHTLSMNGCKSGHTDKT